MDFNKMTLKELEKEMDNFRNQLETQNLPITPAQKSRWYALKKTYKQKSEDLIK